jgi:hypothetical protein
MKTNAMSTTQLQAFAILEIHSRNEILKINIINEF